MRLHRKDRINEVIRRAVSSIILAEVKDPRVGFVTITRVEVVDDLKEARVYFTVLGNEEQKRETLHALNHMRGFIQKDLGPALKTRFTPVLIFELDTSTENFFHMDRLIGEARASDSDHQAGAIPAASEPTEPPERVEER